MDQRLIDVAEAGDIDALYALLRQNSYVLEKLDRVPFVSTPLHMAVSAGQTRFVKEIASLKPSFARKLNEDGYSPIHLASTNGHLELVRELLKISDDLCLLKGREKRTPLHSAAIAGSIDVLGELLKACPKSLGELTVREETALHLAVKSNQFEAFKLLLEWLKQNNKKDVVNWKDDEGNTVLHLAASIKQRQMMEKMLGSNSAGEMKVDVNARNLNNQTALDVILQLPGEEENRETPDVILQLLGEIERREIEGILQRAGVVPANDIISASHIQVLPNIPMRTIRRRPSHLTWSWASYLKRHKEKDSPSQVRNALLVVAVLIATETFQTGVTPPGGYWQDDCNLTQNKTNITTAAQYSDTAGTPILLTKLPMEFALFTVSNFLGFFVSMLMIQVLIKGFPLRPLLLIAQVLMMSTYLFSLNMTIGNTLFGRLLIILLVLLLYLLFFLFFFGAQTFKLAKKVFWRIWNRLTGSADGSDAGS